MKKLTTVILILIITALPVINVAQVGEGTSTSGTSCKNALLQSFASCLASNGINYFVTNAGTNTICVNAVGNSGTAPGYIQSCIAHYDNSRSNCPEAPAIVYQTGSSSKSTKRVIMNQ